MAAVISDIAEKRALMFLTGQTGYTVRLVTLRLFKNDFTPAQDSVVGDFTVADFTGYADQNYTNAQFTPSGDTPTLATGATKTFTSSADQTQQDIYGWYLVTATDNEVIASERFADAPFPIVNNGDAIPVTVRLTASNG